MTYNLQQQFTISPFNCHKFTNAQTSQANNPSPAVRRLAQIPAPTPVNSITETSDLSTRCHDPSHGRDSVLPLPITSVDHTQSTANHHLDFEIHPSRTAGFPIPCSAVALGSLSPARRRSQPWLRRRRLIWFSPLSQRLGSSSGSRQRSDVGDRWMPKENLVREEELGTDCGGAAA
ncbi:hypothetical protein M0R45_010862 [Rubus argutus]|uniref:Uncharacterized protein n=1 Tax=Rubus argutus TaxID=59490 RepID=A0AAW1Y919_RUBAR